MNINRFLNEYCLLDNYEPTTGDPVVVIETTSENKYMLATKQNTTPTVRIRFGYLNKNYDHIYENKFNITYLNEEPGPNHIRANFLSWNEEYSQWCYKHYKRG